MKRINHFKPNVKPDHTYAERQWKWNWLRKMKKIMIAEEKPIDRKDFVQAASAIGLHPHGQSKTR